MWYDLFSKLATKGDLLLYDLTSVFTHSKNIKLAERGYNADHEYIDQIGVIMAFSSITKLPVGIDVFYGSMKDITTVRDFIARFPKKDIGFIFDRGFSSYGLLDDLRGDGIHYIVPLLKSLREKGLTNKISVEEVLFELSKVTKIVEKSGREYFAKIPKRARRMCSLFPEVLPMG